MNKQYMDFVPAKTKKVPSAPKMVTVQTTTTEVVSVVEEKMPAPKTMNLGVVENLNSKFVKSDVPKRPLSQKPLTAGDALAAIKAQKVKADKIPKPVAKPVKPSKEPVKSEKSHVYQAPKAQFINQEKIVKRPLSKNVYLRELEKSEKTEAEPQKPITIVSEPKKKSRLGAVFAVILTIILGAAAGAVAFLLLPK